MINYPNNYFDGALSEPYKKIWKEIYRILKPGASILVYNNKQSHRLTCEIENAGFEIRDTISWLHGYGITPITLAMKPVERNFVSNALKYGVAGLNINESRITSEQIKTTSSDRDYPGETNKKESEVRR